MKTPEQILRQDKYKDLNNLVLICEAMEEYHAQFEQQDKLNKLHDVFHDLNSGKCIMDDIIDEGQRTAQRPASLESLNEQIKIIVKRCWERERSETDTWTDLKPLIESYRTNSASMESLIDRVEGLKSPTKEYLSSQIWNDAINTAIKEIRPTPLSCERRLILIQILEYEIHNDRHGIHYKSKM